METVNSSARNGKSLAFNYTAVESIFAFGSLENFAVRTAGAAQSQSSSEVFVVLLGKQEKPTKRSVCFEAVDSKHIVCWVAPEVLCWSQVFQEEAKNKFEDYIWLLSAAIEPWASRSRQGMSWINKNIYVWLGFIGFRCNLTKFFGGTKWKMKQL